MPTWRNMEEADLDAANKLSDTIHINYPEDAEIFKERYLLYPNGCFVLEERQELVGYAISHPWKNLSAPKLNTLLGFIPEDSDTYYIHDIGIVACKQRKGAGKEILTILKQYAQIQGYALISLVSVNNSYGFCKSNGFETVYISEMQKELLSYDENAAYMQCKL